MSYFYYTGDADANKSRFISQIERYRDKVVKNFDDMDIENATAKNEIEREIDSIKTACNSLISTLEEI